MTALSTTTDTAADLQRLRAKLKGAIAEYHAEEGRLAALDQALSKAREEGWATRTRLGDAETALRRADSEAIRRRPCDRRAAVVTVWLG